MKVVILAGGFGTRLSEETGIKPKPLVEIGGMPILWHIMKLYSAYGYNDFVVCLGYKGYLIKEFFANYFLHRSDVTIDLAANSVEVLDSQVEPWKITLIDTGAEAMTGGRIKRIQPQVGNEPFMLTYGDGVSNVNIRRLLSYHRKHKKYCTVTAVQPGGKFGALNISKYGIVDSFREKPKGDGTWINGGFFVCEPQVFDYIKDSQTLWELDPMENLAKQNQMAAYLHKDFWRPMDTLRDKSDLETIWNTGKAPWKVW
ncbi:MAG: glucose-1-phosphate cytidylyltransferase [Prevotellaceae bacterium]|jgi:glucose-1-phosphate cytidylyltransferase|nr:glucose-1-phosphate cytidylyltransferase [Prevotellaceae bacterium]